MKELQEKLDLLLTKYSVPVRATILDRETAKIDGIETPLLPHRAKRSNVELRKLVQGGTLEDVSVMRTGVVASKSEDLFVLLARELDLAAFVLGKKILTVTAVKSGPALNVLAGAEDGILYTLELSVVLPAGSAEKAKHEIISRRGVACDVAVDAQLMQDSVYLFGKEEKKFTDVDYELYGLTPDDVAVVRSAFEAAKTGDAAERIHASARAVRLAEAAKLSLTTGERQALTDETA